MTESETLLTFPCEFIIKVFGNKSEEFEKTVISIMHANYENLNEDAFSFRPSSDNKYLSISIKIQAQSKDQLDNIYRELSSNPLVLMVL